MIINNITNERKKLVKFYSIKSKSKNLNLIRNTLSYPCTWYDNLGYYKILNHLNKSSIKFYFSFIKEILLISNLHNYEEIIIEKNIKKNYKNLALSWSNSFSSKNYTYKDSYLPKIGNCINFILNVGPSYKNKNNLKNTIIFQKKNQNLNYIFLTKKIFSILINFRFNFKDSLLKLNWSHLFSGMIYNKIHKLIKEKKIQNLYLPYEAQPFQKYLIIMLRKKFPHIKIIGYLNAIQPFPIHLYNKNIIPDLSYSMSRTQIYQLTKIFKWRKEKIRLTKSNRFRIKNRKKYLNKFILPYYISNKSKLLSQIDYLLQILPDRIFIKPSILPHPVGKTDNKYKDFLREMKILIDKYDTKFRSKSKKNFAVVIGSTTTVLECLEHHLTVYHVTPVPVLEALDPLFWPKVKINSLDNGIFLYSYYLKKKLINY